MCGDYRLGARQIRDGGHDRVDYVLLMDSRAGLGPHYRIGCCGRRHSDVRDIFADQGTQIGHIKNPESESGQHTQTPFSPLNGPEPGSVPACKVQSSTLSSRGSLLTLLYSSYMIALPSEY